LEEERQKLGELNAYRHNYASRRERPGNVSSVHWQDYQNFLARLDGAVRSQQQVVRDCQEKLEVHRRRWMARRQRLESLERVLQRFEDEERQQAERRQQRQVDDRPRNRSRYEGG
ncbi:MAG: flagellar export protein FliJ, partial [Woeseiaceae bacterium]